MLCALSSTRPSDPLVFDVAEPPLRFEAEIDGEETGALVEVAGPEIPRESVQPQAAARRLLRPRQHLRTDAATLKAHAHVQLRYRLGRGGNETCELVAQHREANLITGKHFRQEVLTLLRHRMRIDDADACLEAGAPHRNELVEAPGIVFDEHCSLHGMAHDQSTVAPVSLAILP